MAKVKRKPLPSPKRAEKKVGDWSDERWTGNTYFPNAGIKLPVEIGANYEDREKGLKIKNGGNTYAVLSDYKERAFQINQGDVLHECIDGYYKIFNDGEWVQRHVRPGAKYIEKLKEKNVI